MSVIQVLPSLRLFDFNSQKALFLLSFSPHRYHATAVTKINSSTTVITATKLLLR